MRPAPVVRPAAITITAAAALAAAAITAAAALAAAATAITPSMPGMWLVITPSTGGAGPLRAPLQMAQTRAAQAHLW